MKPAKGHGRSAGPSSLAFWILTIVVLICVLLCLYVVFFRSVQQAELVPTFTAGNNTKTVTNKASLRKTGQGTDTYVLTMSAMPSVATQWCTFTVTPDSIFDWSNVLAYTVQGTSSIDGTSATTPTNILQILPTGTGSKITVNYFSNSLFEHTISLICFMK